MRFIFCSFFAYLALTVLAVDLHGLQQDLELPPGAYWKDGNTLVVANDEPVFPDATEDSVQDVVVNEDITDAAAKVTMPVLNERDDLPGQYAVQIRVGRTTKGSNDSPQHVGTLRGHRLYRPIYDCLKVLGHPQGRGGFLPGMMPTWNDPAGHPMLCTDDNLYCQEECEIPNIVYNSGGDTYATNAQLSVRVRWSEIWESAHEGLREVIYKAIADVYTKMVDEEANCYTVHFKGSRATKMCNISRHVMVAFPTNGGDIAGRVNVAIEFSRKTTEGDFKCDYTIGSIDTNFRAKGKSAVAQVMKWDESKIALFSTCQDPQCFDIDNDDAYEVGEKWKEPSGCEAPKGQAQGLTS